MLSFVLLLQMSNTQILCTGYIHNILNIFPFFLIQGLQRNTETTKQKKHRPYMHSHFSAMKAAIWGMLIIIIKKLLSDHIITLSLIFFKCTYMH